MGLSQVCAIPAGMKIAASVLVISLFHHANVASFSAFIRGDFEHGYSLGYFGHVV